MLQFVTLDKKGEKFMADIGTKEAATKWNVSQQIVSKWCREGKIRGATQDRKGSPWHIPANAEKPNFVREGKSNEK